MTGAFLGNYLLALAVVALLLFGLYSVVRALSRGRVLSSTDRRLVSVVESTFVAQNTTLHIVKIGSKYYAVGGGSGHLSVLCEVPAEDVAPWLESQRKLFGEHAAPLTGFLNALRRPPR